jgi:hypothetical protein
MMNYIAVKEAEGKWGISRRSITLYCIAGQIKGAEKIGNMWLIPKDAKSLRTAGVKK